MKLKHRLSISLTLVTALVLAVSFALALVLVRREETEDLDRAILAQATVAAYLVQQHKGQEPWLSDGPGEIPEIPSLVRRYEALYDSRGTLLESSPTFTEPPPPYDALHLPVPLPNEGVVVELQVGGAWLRGVVLPVGPPSERRPRLLYALTRRAVDDDLRYLSQVFAVLFLAATSLTALLSRWLGARLSHDVNTIADVAREVTRGNLAARVARRSQGSSELSALGSDMDSMIEQLGGLMASQRTFISHAAHELRSPLATLRGQLQLALRRPRTADEYRETIEESLAEAEALIALAEDLLVLARLQNTGPTREASCVLGEAIHDALRMARGLADERHVSFQNATPHVASLQVKGARADLARAIRNLLDNAVTHSPSGSVVHLTASRHDHTLHLAITDQGSGVTHDEATHIFSPFYRGSKDQSGEGLGTGLGLAIVREIATAAGGSVRLDLDHRPGARFILELPLVA